VAKANVFSVSSSHFSAIFVYNPL